MQAFSCDFSFEGKKETERRVFFSLEELSGIAHTCPAFSFEDLPKPFSAIVYWQGKLYPVLDLSFTMGFASQANLSERFFLFTRAMPEFGIPALALAVPKTLRPTVETNEDTKVIPLTKILKKYILGDSNDNKQ